MSSRILVVDDDVALAEMIGIVLQNEGFDVVFCADGSQALAQFQESHPDLVLLDVMLPGMDGFDVCRAIRRISDAPIVMLTARSDTSDVVTGLEAGADDYVPKPFKPKELVARMRARLRGREDAQVDEGLTLQDLSIDVAGHVVKRGGHVIALTPLEFDLLVTLARAPWKVFSREELMEQVWGYDYYGDLRAVDVAIRRLREKIEDDPAEPKIIQTVRGIGYKVDA